MNGFAKTANRAAKALERYEIGIDGLATPAE
jgi:hypothetical protein